MSVFSNFQSFDYSPLTANDASFTSNFNQNQELAGIISLSSLSSEFGAMSNFVRHKLGSPIVETELSPESIAICFEEANLKFSSIVNSYFVTSWFASVLGISKNYTQFDFQNALPKSNNVFVQAFAANLTRPIDAGTSDKRKGRLDSIANQSTYDFYSDTVDDSSGLPLEQYVASVSGYDVHIINVFFGQTFYMNRFYDPFMQNQYLMTEFGFPSQPSDTVFYILPQYEDVYRAMENKGSDYLRKPQWKYMKNGRNISFTPKLNFGIGAPRIWFEYWIDYQPGTEESPLARGSFSGLDYLQQANQQIATSFGNVPVSDLSYSTCNSIGKTWIREYTFALCLETLGWTRNKFTSWTIPGGETVSLNGSELASAGQTRRTELVTQLNTFLDNIDGYKMMEKEAAKAQQMVEILKAQPMPIYLM